MLKIEKLSVNAEEKEIIKDFNLKINDGEIHVLMGPNGAGKSTICKSLFHHPRYQIKSGKILFKNQDITHLTTSEISRLGMYYVSQNPIEIEGISNAEMLRTALSEHGKPMDIFSFNNKCEEICKKLQMPKNFLYRHVNVGMSGGERKKNELFPMWLLEPDFILFDEIDSGLDVDALKIIGENIKEYQKMKKASILIITHQEQLIRILNPDVVHIMQDGKIIQTGNLNLAIETLKNGFIRANDMKACEKNE